MLSEPDGRLIQEVLETDYGFTLQRVQELQEKCSRDEYRLVLVLDSCHNPNPNPNPGLIWMTGARLIRRDADRIPLQEPVHGQQPGGVGVPDGNRIPKDHHHLPPGVPGGLTLTLTLT